MYDALADKPYFEPVFLNDLVPTETRDHYHFMQMLKTRGCPTEKTLLCTYSTGNIKGNYHFIWIMPSDTSAEELQSQNASVLQRLSAQMPQFHSKAL